MKAILVLNYFLLLLPFVVIGQDTIRTVKCKSFTNQPVSSYLKTSASEAKFYEHQRNLLWEIKSSGEVTSCLIGNDGKIYLTTQDTILLCLNNQGKEIWSDHINGSHSYAQMLPYRKNGFIVLVDETVYRDKFDDSKLENYLVYYRNRELVWSRAFPANATMKIIGKRIYAVYYQKRQKRHKRIY